MATDAEIIEQCVDFLKRSSQHYGEFVERKKRDLEIYSGDFWSAQTKKAWKRTKRRCLAVDNWSVLSNAIVSPMSASPWHIQLKDQKDEIGDELQESINEFEFDSDSKRAYLSALRNASLLGTGFVVLTTIQRPDGVHVVLENIDDVSRVAMDPAISTTSGKDAEEAALVSQISLKRAKRLFGPDVVPMDYPSTPSAVSDIGDQWGNDPDFVKLVTYYIKANDGVDYYKICGNKVVEHERLPVATIPVLRLTGYQVWRNHKFDYVGIVDKTMSLTTLTNVAFSTMAERLNSSPKNKFIASCDSVSNLEDYYRKITDEDAILALYNKGTPAPIPYREQFETADLVATIQQTQSLIEAVVGIPVAGVNGLTKKDQTATEILAQQNSLESNVSVFFDSAFEVQKEIGNILIQLLNNGESREFELQSGPDLITRNMRKQKELNAMLPLVPEQMKPVVAKYYAETLESGFADSLANNIVANLDPSIKLIADDGDVDPFAIHQLRQYQQQVEDTLNELEAVTAERDELKKQMEQMQTSLFNQREKMQQDWAKFEIQESNKMNLETAKLAQSGAVDADKIKLEHDRLTLDAATELAEQQRENNKIIGGI